MDWVDATQFLLIVGGVIASTPFLYIGVRLLRSDPAQFEVNHRRSGSWWEIFHGEVPARHNGELDPGVARGMTIETRKRKDGTMRYVWVPQGKLARESINSVLD